MSNKFSFREYLSEFATTTSAHIHIISNLLRQRTKEQKIRNVDVCKLFLSPQLSVCVCVHISLWTIETTAVKDIATITFIVTNRQHKDKNYDDFPPVVIFCCCCCGIKKRSDRFSWWCCDGWKYCVPIDFNLISNRFSAVLWHDIDTFGSRNKRKTATSAHTHSP